MSSHAPDAPGTSKRAVKLRTKLIASIVGVIIVLSAVIGVVTEAFLSNSLTAQLDTRLNTLAGGNPGDRGGGGLGTQPGTGGSVNRTQSFTDCQSRAVSTGSGTTAAPTVPAANAAQPDGSLFARVSAGTVTGTIRPTIFTCDPIATSVASTLLSLKVDGVIRTVDLPGYGEYRVQATTRTVDSTTITIITGTSLQGVSDTLTSLAVIMALVAGGAIILGGLIVFVIVRRSVRPLERVAATARKVATLPLDKGEVDLAIRVPARDTDARTEIGSVGAAINQMLGHVSGALTARHASETRVRQFVADASHELRTPLAAIRGYAELARRGEHEPGAVAHALRRVESESARMTTLVDDLLLLARLDSGRPLATEEVDLTMLAVDRVSDARVAGTDHRWQLDLPDEPVTVTGDGARLHQVLANLLANARTHTPPGTVVVTGVRREAGGAVMTVTDNGPGIPEELQPEIFGRFVRGDSSRSRAAGSTGLGLAIVAAVIAAHGGTVTVDSRPGRTHARVWLPDHVEISTPPIGPPTVDTSAASVSAG